MGIVTGYTFTSNIETVTKTKLNSIAGDLVTEFNGSIDDDNISETADIAYSKLDLVGQILNTDISASAAIDYDKLVLTDSILNADINSSAAIAYSKLSLANSILNADINASAAIAYSKLSLANSILNADINASAAIAYSKLALSNSIMNADINASAAIADTKLAQITTASKVSGAAITSLTSLPAGAGVIPSANLPTIDNTRIVVLKVIADDETLTTGDGQMYITIPAGLNGMNLTGAAAHVYTASSSGLPTIMIRNVTDTSDMLSVAITIDENETDSSTATTAVTIDTGEDDVATADVLAVDVDTAGTGTAGLEVRLTFATP